MGKFGESLKRGPAKVDNHAAAAPGKARLRRWLLSEIGADQARVFDAYAGSGVMHRSVWRSAAVYLGCDLRFFRPPGRRAFVADNCRVLRALDLAAFTIFDLDAYGSPWTPAMIIAERRRLAPGERIGIALTDGGPMKARMGCIPHDMAALAGAEPQLTGMSLRWRELTARAIERMAERMGGKVEAFQVADSASRPILYSAAILRGWEAAGA